MLLVLALAGCTTETTPPPPVKTPPIGTPAITFVERRPKNLFVISIDTTRRDHLDRWATDGIVRAPFLSSLFASGVVLDDHVQCSDWTFASTSCTQRGQLMEETGFYPKLSSATRAPLPQGQPTLAAHLSGLGYRTVLISSNEWLSPTWNNAEGFQEYVHATAGNTGVLMDRAIAEMREAEALGDPWFVHLHLVEPHPPYTPPEGYRDPTLPAMLWDLDSQAGQYDATAEWPTMTPAEQNLLLRHLESRYSGEIRYMDDQLEERWALLRTEGLIDDALVAIWNDHGEQFFEHGHQAHAYGLGAEENDAFLAFVSDRLEPLAWDGPTHAVDFLPTVIDALGLAVPPGLSGYVVGTAPEERPRFSASVARLGPLVAVIDGDWKMQYDLDDGTVGVWNRARDPDELDDRFDPEDAQSLALWELLRPRAELVSGLAPEWDVEWPAELPR